MKKLLSILILLAAAAILFYSGAATWLVNLVAAPPDPAKASTNDPAAAAELGLITLFTVDYEAGIEAWQANLCAASTGNGCQLARSIWARGVQENLERYQTDLACTADAVMLSSSRENQQVWIVEYTTTGWAGSKTELAAVVVERETGTGEWKFAMVIPGLPQAALAQMLTPTVPATTTPTH